MKINVKFFLKNFKWLFFGISLLFIINTFKKNWNILVAVTFDNYSYYFLILSFLITFFSHIWSGLIWVKILENFNLSITKKWGLKIYLTTNISKYIPGNIGHFYGRILALSQQGLSFKNASFGVLLEPLFMATSALMIALLSHFIGINKTDYNSQILFFVTFLMLISLLTLHPFFLQKIIYFLQKNKQGKDNINNFIYLKKYPKEILLGEMVFILLRGLGFILTWIAFIPISVLQIPLLLNVFSLAWLLGLVIPGAPSGIGVFEATIIILLKTENFPISIVLSTITIFRLISILAEVIGAGLGLLTKE